MNSQVALVAEKDEEQKYAVARKSAPNVVKGRRSFFEYPPAPKVQSINVPPYWGEIMLIISFSSTG